jgi:hypothetical protein
VAPPLRRVAGLRQISLEIDANGTLDMTLLVRPCRVGSGTSIEENRPAEQRNNLHTCDERA